MSKFKDMVAADRATTFLNLDEFAETHTVEGSSITAIVDEYALKERRDGADLSIADGTLLLFARTEDLPDERPAGATLNLDGCEYIVVDWAVDMGLASITLSGSRGI